MSGGPASRSRGAPLILMLKRLQHLGSLRLVVRSLASFCALFGVLCCARWLLACGDAVGKIMGPRDAPMVARDWQAIQYSRTEFRWKGRELNVPLVGCPAPSFPRIANSYGNNLKPTSLLPQINLPCCRGSRISSTLRSPVPLLIPCEFLPLWFLAILESCQYIISRQCK